MKILVLTSRVPYPLNDGGNIATMQMLKSLLKCAFEVKLLSLNTNKHFVDTKTLPSIFSECGIETIEINTDVTLKDAFINLFTGGSYNAQRFHSEKFSQLVIKHITSVKFDIVLFEGLYVATYADVVKENCRATRVLRAHNIEHHIWNRASKEESFLKRKYIEMLAHRLGVHEVAHWKKFEAIIAITPVDEVYIRQNNDITKYYITLPTAIDLLDLPETSVDTADLHKIFHLGSMDWVPNQQAMEWFLEKVWKQVEAATDAEFYMAGKNMPEEFFEYKSDRIHVMGEVENVYEFMKDKQLMVVPLFTGSGLRIKILEGMAASKTIITTSVGVQGIFAYDKEHVLIANNPESFAKAIIWCLKNESKSRQIGRNARLLIQDKYSLEKFEMQLYVFLTNLQPTLH